MLFWDEARHALVHTLAYNAGRVIANTAMSDGLRRTISWTQDVMFLGMVEELERLNMSRKIASDMLGMTLRTYQRRLSAIQENPHTGFNLWHRLHSKLDEPAVRETILSWFEVQREPQIISMLHDMVKEGWLRLEHDKYSAVVAVQNWTDELLDEYVQLNIHFSDHDLDAAAWATRLNVDESRILDALERARAVAGKTREVSSVYATYSLFKVCAKHCLDMLTMESDHQATYAYLYRKDFSEEQFTELKKDLTQLQQQAVALAEKYELKDVEYGEFDPDEPAIEWSLMCTYPFE